MFYCRSTTLDLIQKKKNVHASAIRIIKIIVCLKNDCSLLRVWCGWIRLCNLNAIELSHIIIKYKTMLMMMCHQLK